MYNLARRSHNFYFYTYKTFLIQYFIQDIFRYFYTIFDGMIFLIRLIFFYETYCDPF